jgi:hypothetical protein
MIYIEGINMNISFDNVHKFGNILFETQLFKHYHFPDMLIIIVGILLPLNKCHQFMNLNRHLVI